MICVERGGPIGNVEFEEARGAHLFHSGDGQGTLSFSK